MAPPKKQVDARQEERLRIVLQEQGINQNDLAALIYVSRQAVSNYVNCKDRLPLDAAQVIAEKYGYNPAWLLCMDERKTQYEVLLNEVEEADLSFVSSFVILLDALDMMGLKYSLKPSADMSFTEEQWNRFSIYQQIPMSDIHISRNGKDIAKLSADDLSLLQKRMTRYTKMLIEEMLEEGGSDDGEQ